MNRDAILRKIKACLRLAASSNPNEAAAALRQAQAMMAKHDVSAAEVSDVGQADVLTRYRGQTPPTSVLMLARMCADGFGAAVVIIGDWRRTTLRFYGLDGAAHVAEYAFAVLRRQMDRDRLKHIARVRKRGNREARGETFARAWVQALSHLFPSIELAEDKRIALDEHIGLQHPNTEKTNGRDLTKRGKATDDDAWAGHCAGKNAQLNRGVGSAAPGALEHQQ